VSRGAFAGRQRGAPASFGGGRTHGRPPKLILLPGLHGTCALMADFRNALGHDVEAQAIDYPRDQRLDHAQLAALVRPRLPVGKPFVLLGESFSGPVALLLAAQRPPGLRGVVLSTSFAANPRPGLARFAKYATAVPPSAFPVGVFEYFLLGRWATPKLREAFQRVLAEVKPDVLAARLVACLSVDVRATLPKIDVPILYLRGTRDRLVPASAAGLVVAGAKNVHVVDFEAPHCLLQAIPAQAAKAVLEFASLLPAGRM
jgi:pimeloyl-ACP methyl ester carboxylesterase